MKKLKNEGRAVTIVKGALMNCENCIFANKDGSCKTSAAVKFEQKFKIGGCELTGIKYIYDEKTKTAN